MTRSNEPLMATDSTIRGRGSFFRDDFDRTGMARVPCLRVVEDRDPHVEVFARYEVLVVLAPRLEVALHDQGPMTIRPMSFGLGVIAVALILAGDQYSWNDRADWNFRILLLRVGLGLVKEHPPLRAVIHTPAYLRIPDPHLPVCILVILRQSQTFVRH